MHNTRIDFLMATYNGEKFVSDQIDSIMSQTYSNIRLIIRDDCSKDNTILIIQDKIAQYPDKIILIPPGTNLGVIGNFSALLTYTDAAYAMFADQDDIWLPEKVTISFKKME